MQVSLAESLLRLQSAGVRDRYPGHMTRRALLPLLAVTVAAAVPVLPPAAALMVNGPPTVVAVNRPLVEMVPPPAVVQATAGWVVNATAN